MKYRIRIDEDKFTTEDLLTVFKDALSLVLVHHVLPHGNPHYHAYADISVNEQALRLRIKRKLNVSGTNFSLKQCSDEKQDEYVQYLFNKKHDNVAKLIHVINYDSDRLSSLRDKADAVAEQYQVETKTRKAKGPTIWDLSMDVEKRFKERILNVNKLGTPDFIEYHDQIPYQIEVYTEIAIEVLRANSKGFDEFLLRKVITTAISSSQKGTEILKKKMVKSFLNYL